MIGQRAGNPQFKLKMRTQVEIFALAGPFISIHHHEFRLQHLEKNYQFSPQISGRTLQRAIRGYLSLSRPIQYAVYSTIYSTMYITMYSIMYSTKTTIF